MDARGGKSGRPGPCCRISLDRRRDAWCANRLQVVGAVAVDVVVECVVAAAAPGAAEVRDEEEEEEDAGGNGAAPAPAPAPAPPAAAASRGDGGVPLLRSNVAPPPTRPLLCSREKGGLAPPPTAPPLSPATVAAVVVDVAVVVVVAVTAPDAAPASKGEDCRERLGTSGGGPRCCGASGAGRDGYLGAKPRGLLPGVFTDVEVADVVVVVVDECGSGGEEPPPAPEAPPTPAAAAVGAAFFAAAPPAAAAPAVDRGPWGDKMVAGFCAVVGLRSSEGEEGIHS